METTLTDSVPNSPDATPLDELLKPKLAPWERFEAEVATYVEEQMHFGRLGLQRGMAILCRRPRYYSKQRESDITFDVSIEVFPSAEKTGKPFLIWIWECKDYPSKRVSVDEIEEFHHKLHQVGAHKGTVVTRHGFQSAAINLARSCGIGLMILLKEKHFVIQMSHDGGLIERDVVVVPYCLYTSGTEIHGPSSVSGPDLAVVMKHELADLVRDQG